MKILLKLNKLLGKLEKTQFDRKKIVLLIIPSLIVLYIDFSFIVKLQIKGLRSAAEKITERRKDIDGLNKDLATLKRIQASDMKKQGEILKAKKIISEGEMPLLLQNISDIANRHKVKIMQIKPLKDAKAKAEVIEGKTFSPIAITLDLSCGYHSLGSFINGLENAQFFMGVQDIKITRSNDDYLSEKAGLTLKTYVKK